MIGFYTNFDKSMKTRLERNNDDDAGQDLYASEDCYIESRSKGVVNTNLAIALPPGHVGLIWSRSGLSVKHDLEVGAGCIDLGYRGEVKVVIRNFGEDGYQIKKGDKIAQLLTIPVNLWNYSYRNSLDETKRGDDGFGKSGY